MNDIEIVTLDDGTTLLIYEVRLSGEWRWTHRDNNYESMRGGLLGMSKGIFYTKEQAKEDFFMKNDYDDQRDVKAPWALIIGIVVAIVAMLGVMSYTGRAKAHDGHDEVSKFYDNWKIIPARTSSCCNKKDCYATEFRNVGGKWYALRREDRAWIYVHDTKLEHNAADPLDSPDGQGHVCMQPPGYGDQVWCAVLGTGV